MAVPSPTSLWDKRAHRIGQRVQSAREWLGAFFLAAWIGGAVGAVAGPQAVPEPPAPSAAVQSLLDEADRRTKAKQPQEALAAADRALAVAQAAKDAIGEAQAERSRALALQELRRTEAAVAAWRAAAAAWERVGDGPGRVEALATAMLPPTSERTEAPRPRRRYRSRFCVLNV